MADSTQPTGPAPDGSAPGDPAAAAHGFGGDLIGGLRALLADLQGVVADRVELLSLELRRFGRTLGLVVVLGAVALLLAATAWVAAWAAAAAGLHAAGLPMALAVLLVAVVNLVAAGIAALVARRQLPRLGLPATRRHLTVAPGIRPPVARTGEAAGPAGTAAMAAGMASPRRPGDRPDDDGPGAAPPRPPQPPAGDRRAAAAV